MFYAQVKELCDKNNIKITTLARKLNLSPSAPNNWLSGSLPKAETIIKIADYFGVSTDYLLRGVNANQTFTSNNSGTISGANVVINSRAETIASYGETSASSVVDMTEDEKEILRIFRNLDVRSRAKAITYLYELEENK